jgi:IclR family transcriptional regulator, acetate operon repressor
MLLLDEVATQIIHAHNMSNWGIEGSQSAERAIALLDAVAFDAGAQPVTEIASQLGLAPSTARRLLAVLVRRGLIMRISRGRYIGGERLRLLAAKANPHARIAEITRPVLRRLARQYRCTAHLGMFENEMVTYLVKEGTQTVFTREHNQLEAYCTGIGKALLAQLPTEELNAYLAQPLVPLTATTITDADILREALINVRTSGYAVDNREMADDLFCIAVPLDLGLRNHFAISISGHPAIFGDQRTISATRVLMTRAQSISDAFSRVGGGAGIAP